METEENRGEASPSRRNDLVALTKAKLSLLVVLTTAAGFHSALSSQGEFPWWLFFHTLFGTVLAAFGAAVFNQLMEMEADRKMSRTEDRPLPAGRVPPGAAFGLGWVLCAFGIVHLGVKVNALASFLAGLTIAVYLFAYTPLKRRSSKNTLVGAVAGAIPPVIGWVGAGGGLDAGAFWWFSLLFLWQMPHFFAINWLHREEYLRAGFAMLANEDGSGIRTARAAFLYAALLLVLTGWGAMIPLVERWSAVLMVLASGYFAGLAWKFLGNREQREAKRLFLGSLLYLPLILILSLLGKS